MLVRPGMPRNVETVVTLPVARRAITGFTLVELMVTVTIIGLLIAILLPCLAQAQAVARQVVCLSNLRQIGLATQYYVRDNRSYPPTYVDSTCRWMDLLKPYVPKNCGVYRCPEDRNAIACDWDPQIVLSYGMNTFNFTDNAHCFWYGVWSLDVCRPQQTILLGDCTPGLYYCGGGRRFADPVSCVDYRHPGKTFNALYCDGRVANLKTTAQRDWDAAQ